LIPIDARIFIRKTISGAQAGGQLPQRMIGPISTGSGFAS
jgi:hypothetical protein